MDNEMLNEEMVEVTNEVVQTSFGKGFKIGVGVGVAILAGGIAYKYVVKPIRAKRKAKKELSSINEGLTDNVVEFEAEQYFEEDSDK